ncbi:MAG: uncharacterized protein QOK28_1533 [Actinomycetota bacterium]|jgi:nitroimidazol reductase NimA-like FMN-containing flavoprotein (pyridoxamine 5'-phosphate oxidase superfamily)
MNNAKTMLVTIGPRRCADLLASARLGRLAVIVAGRPEIFPVNHVYDREAETVTFPVHEGTKMNGALEWPWVAFEVDGMDLENNIGWSVAVVGAAEEIVDAETLARLSCERDVRWGDGPRWLRIVPTKVTGREIQAYL